MLSLAGGASGTTRALPGPVSPGSDGADSLAALLVTNAALKASAHLAPEASPGAPPAVPAPRAPAAPSATAPAAAPSAGAAVPPEASVTAPPAVRAARPAGTGWAQAGVASWLDIAAGTCANNAAPMGAVITVTNAIGISVTCKVVSTGPFVAGRVVDLSRTTFAALGSVSSGLVSVTVTW